MGTMAWLLQARSAAKGVRYRRRSLEIMVKCYAPRMVATSELLGLVLGWRESRVEDGRCSITAG
jgi:hypothetical protein